MSALQDRRLVTALTGALFVAAWSSGFLVAKVATADASPFSFLLWRFAVIVVVLGIWGGARGDLRRISAADLRRQGLVGLLGQLGYCVFVYLSISRGVATGTTALVDAVQPMVIATLVGPLLGVVVRAPQWLGLLLGGGGTGVVVWSQSGALDADPLALVLPLAAMCCLIAATLLDRRRPGDLPVVSALAVHAVVTTVALLVLCAITGSLTPPRDPAFWIATAIAVVGPGLGGYGSYWYLLRRVGVTALNGLLFLVAPVTAITGALAFSEPVNAATCGGFVLCAGGVVLVLWRRSDAASPPAHLPRARPMAHRGKARAPRR